MPAMKASGMVDDAIALSCTQRPGDFVYIPNYWGHLTLNHGFTIGWV
jgi:oxalate decarboxylase/phosphoglucose isomerase-like protein (cupin superfamily)